MRSKAYVLQTVNDVGEAVLIVFIGDRSTLASLVYLKSITPSECSDELGAACRVYQERRPTLNLSPKESLDCTQAWVDIVSRGGEAGETHPGE